MSDCPDYNPLSISPFEIALKEEFPEVLERIMPLLSNESDFITWSMVFFYILELMRKLEKTYDENGREGLRQVREDYLKNMKKLYETLEEIQT